MYDWMQTDSAQSRSNKWQNNKPTNIMPHRDVGFSVSVGFGHDQTAHCGCTVHTSSMVYSHHMYTMCMHVWTWVGHLHTYMQTQTHSQNAHTQTQANNETKRPMFIVPLYTEWYAQGYSSPFAFSPSRSHIKPHVRHLTWPLLKQPTHKNTVQYTSVAQEKLQSGRTERGLMSVSANAGTAIKIHWQRMQSYC